MPIVQIAHLVRQIEACDREIGRLNATSAAKFGHIRIVLSGAAPAITALFQDALVWDTFIAVAGLQSTASCILCGRRERQAPRQAISQFASGGLNRGRSRADARPRLTLLDHIWRQEPPAPLHLTEN